MDKINGLQLKDGAVLKAGDRIEVYYNITRGGFSIVSRDKNNPMNGKVLAYAENVLIENATFHLNLNKLNRIFELNRKTVYAVVRGYFVSAEEIDQEGFNPGYCNPFKTGKFIDWNSKEEIKEAKQVYFYDKFFAYK